MPRFSSPLKVAVPFVRHIAVNIQNILSHVLGTHLQMHVQYQSAFPSRLCCHFLYFPYAAISTMQLTNNCVACKAEKTTTKINDRKIFWLHEFSSKSNQNLTISLGLVIEKHQMKLLGVIFRQTKVPLHIRHAWAPCTM